MPENHTKIKQPDFDLIAKYYDLLYAERLDDLEMWLELTGNVEGDLLEIGCGTGRVTIPLLQQGRRVTGIELSTVALDAARAKLRAGGFTNATLYQADMRAFDLPQKNFAFAFIPINTFMHCLTAEDQQAALQSVHNHLEPGGVLVVDVFHPHPQILLEADGRMQLEDQLVDALTGHTIQQFVVRCLEPDRQIQHVTMILDEIMEDGTVARGTFAFPMRYVYRYEMELLLKEAGFALQTIFGDYDLSPFGADSLRMISIAQKV